MCKQSQYAPDDLTIRPPTPDDVQRTYELVVRCDVDDYGEPDVDLEDLTFDWEQIDLSLDAWLAATPAGDLVGFGMRRVRQYDEYEKHIPPLTE